MGPHVPFAPTLLGILSSASLLIDSVLLCACFLKVNSNKAVKEKKE